MLRPSGCVLMACVGHAAPMSYPLKLRGGAAVAVVDYTKPALDMFNNIRIPAALVAGAVLPLGFGFPFPEAADTRLAKTLKRTNVAIGLISLVSELIAIIYATFLDHGPNRRPPPPASRPSYLL